MMHSLPADLHPLEGALLERLGGLDQPATVSGFDPMVAATLIEAQITSRVLDHTARWLRAEHDLGYYTIGSAGHEANALVALALRHTDPALLHYRSGGFYLARSLQAEQAGAATTNPVDDILRGMLARTTEPIAGGRHKVFGSHQLSIVPQTSTIASHLPRAVGLALSFEMANGHPLSWPEDAVVVCSFGDGSLNHSTAQGACNWASQLSHAGRRVPVMFVCEDNGLGLSVATTPGWVRDSVEGRAAMDYVAVDGSDPAEALAILQYTANRMRESGRPAFVHLKTVRYLGHAGTDVEAAYRSPEQLRADLARDPIAAAAELAVGSGACTGTDLVDWYLDLRALTRHRGLELRAEPEFASAAEVMAPLSDLHALPRTVAPAPALPPQALDTPDRLTLAQTINRALSELLATRPETLVFGEDVGRKGGVYGVTRGLQKQFGETRVQDTVLDEQSVMGLALGSALNGFLPIPEIQYLAYLHNAEDQLRGEAATQGFFSQRQFGNPMVVRVASYAYQRGFGGHFHNDNSVAVLRDIPGLVIASPAHPADAAAMLHACAAHAKHTGAVCVYLEPIARYHSTDLYQDGDGGWTAPYEPAAENVHLGRLHGGGDDLTILTWGNGLFLSLRAARELRNRGIDARILDLRWLAPLPVQQMLRHANATGRVLIVDETRRTGGVAEGIMAELLDAGYRGPLARVTARDSLVPLGAAANLVLVSEADILDAATALVQNQDVRP